MKNLKYNASGKMSVEEVKSEPEVVEVRVIANGPLYNQVFPVIQHSEYQDTVVIVGPESRRGTFSKYNIEIIPPYDKTKFRLLARGEKIQEGDMIYCFEKWCRTHRHGADQLSEHIYIRPLPEKPARDVFNNNFPYPGRNEDAGLTQSMLDAEKPARDESYGSDDCERCMNRLKEAHPIPGLADVREELEIKTHKDISFLIDSPSELDAGIHGFTDEITITIDSGDPGGCDGEFEEFMADALREWYDGAKVEMRKED